MSISDTVIDEGRFTIRKVTLAIRQIPRDTLRSHAVPFSGEMLYRRQCIATCTVLIALSSVLNTISETLDAQIIIDYLDYGTKDV